MIQQRINKMVMMHILHLLFIIFQEYIRLFIKLIASNGSDYDKMQL